MTTEAEEPRVWEPPKTWPHSTPAKLVAGVNWWLNSDPDHYEDVVAMTEDHQDALILSGLQSVMAVVWVDPEGRVRTLKGRWDTVHEEEDEEEAEAIKVSAAIDEAVEHSRAARYAKDGGGAADMSDTPEPQMETVTFDWSTEKGRCQDCGLPAAYRLVHVAFDGGDFLLCSVDAAYHAAYGDEIEYLFHEENEEEET